MKLKVKSIKRIFGHKYIEARLKNIREIELNDKK